MGFCLETGLAEAQWSVHGRQGAYCDHQEPALFGVKPVLDPSGAWANHRLPGGYDRDGSRRGVREAVGEAVGEGTGEGAAAPRGGSPFPDGQPISSPAASGICDTAPKKHKRTSRTPKKDIAKGGGRPYNLKRSRTAGQKPCTAFHPAAEKGNGYL